MGGILLFRLSSKSSTYAKLPAHLSEDEPGLKIFYGYPIARTGL